jgi:hypothetical protein
MNGAESLLKRICAACLRPDSELTVSEWADQYRFLSSESAAEHGKWATLPFQREPFDSMGDQRVYRVVIKSATQMLKTETILNGIGYFAHQDPGPMLVLQPRDADAKAFSKERIAPMIRDTPALTAYGEFFPPSIKRAISIGWGQNGRGFSADLINRLTGESCMLGRERTRLSIWFLGHVRTAVHTEAGLYVPVDLESLIERIVISPFAPSWFVDLVKALARKYELGKDVAQSSLTEDPVY